MPVPTDSSLMTVSFILTREQVRRLRALRDAKSSEHRRVSFAEVGREVVAEGLKAVFDAPNTGIGTSMIAGEGRAA